MIKASAERGGRTSAAQVGRRERGEHMPKPRVERSLLFPSKEFREQVRQASKDRGFRSEQAFILAACATEMRRGEGREATIQFEARVAATLTNLAKQVHTVQTLAPRASCLDRCFPKVRYNLCCGAARRCSPGCPGSRQVAVWKDGACRGGKHLEQEQRYSQRNARS